MKHPGAVAFRRTSAPEDPALRSLTFELPALSASVAEARHRVQDRLGAWGFDPDTCDTAVLVVSELVTNALVHTSSSVFSVSLWGSSGRLRIAVADQGGDVRPPAARRAAADEENGRGLMLVSSLTDAWGIGSNGSGGGRIVWAVLHPPLM